MTSSAMELKLPVDAPPEAPPDPAGIVDVSAFADADRPGSWSRQMIALLDAGHYREAYELLSEKVPFVENQLRYFAAHLVGEENQWSLIHRRLAGLIEDGRPQYILDVGCAVGCHAIEFGRHGHQTWGVDILPGMIQRGRELVESLVLTQRVHLLEGDIRKLETCFEPKFLDSAVASDIFEHLDDDSLLEVLAGLKKVLRPGGKIAIQTSPGRHYYWFDPDRWKVLALLAPMAWLPDGLFSHYVRALDRVVIRGILREPRSFYRHEYGHINCFDPIHLRGLLRRAGLNNIRTWAEHTHPGFKDEGCMRTQRLRRWFGKKSIACRNVYGTATV